MNVIVTAGGTGGHIYPALAIIDKIKKEDKDSKILYIGTTNRMEKDIVPNHNIDYMGIEMYGLSKNILKDIKVGFLILKNTNKIKKIMKEFKPDVVIGIGGYVTYPVIKAAKSLGIKTFIHEQNVIPGKSNKALAKLADKVGISFEATKDFFDEKKCVYTGNPCGPKAVTVRSIPKEKFGVKKDRKCVLMVQGSLGSSSLNEKLLQFLKNSSESDFDVIYVTGKSSYENFSKNELPSNVHVVPYVDDLPGLMKNMDVIVSRAGATSIAEVCALKIPTIFIPSPYVANNHQVLNALELAKHRAAVLITEDAVNAKILREQIDDILDNNDKKLSMQVKMNKFDKRDSLDIIYKLLRDMVDSDGRGKNKKSS